MRFLSVCSGIEAASVAWLPLGWKCAGVSEIEPFPCAVLAHHYPEVKNFGDFTKIEASDIGTVDLLVGGTPCQDFSVAGLRAGIAGDRGRLTVEYCKLAQRLRPRWLVWENVPGVLSADDGNAFGIFLGALAELGYGTAYRVLDAQHFGVPQRRRRVFVVGYFGDWRAAAAVLFERESLSGHPAPSREAGTDASFCITSRFGSGRNDPTAETYISGVAHQNGGAPPAIAFQCQGSNVGEMGTLRAGNGDVQSGVPFIFQDSEYGVKPYSEAGSLRAGRIPEHQMVIQRSAVRRLTPTECERLQGFPDDYTLVPYRGKPAADGPRYRALGNSMAVPCMTWIGERIAMVESLVAA